MRIEKTHLAMACLMLLVCYIMCHNISAPWVGSHDYASSAFSLAARNHVTYGFRVTRFASIHRLDRNAPAESEVYTGHPMLYPIVVSLSHRIFGPSEAASRLVAILVSLGSVLGMYALMSRLFGRGVALVSAVFFGLSPLNLYYGRVVDLLPPITLSIILATLAYVRWLESRSLSRYLVLVGVMLVGMLIDWEAYYFCAIFPAHYLLFAPDKTHRGKVLALVALGPVMFGLWIGHVYLADGDRFAQIWRVFLFRSGLLPAAEQVAGWGRAYQHSVLEFVERIWEHLANLVGLSALMLTLTGLALPFAQWNSLREKRLALTIPFVLLAPAVCHCLIFHNVMYCHDYLVLLLLPGVAAFAGIAFVRLWSAGGPAQVSAILAVVLLSTFLVGSAHKTRRLFWREHLLPVTVGEELRGATRFEDEILLVGTLFHPAIEWYADRNLYFLGLEKGVTYQDLLDREEVNVLAVLKDFGDGDTEENGHAQDAATAPHLPPPEFHEFLRTQCELFAETETLRLYRPPQAPPRGEEQVDGSASSE